MPKISSYTFAGPLAYSDRLVGVFSGATNGVSLQQFRDFFGVGTNIFSLAAYPEDAAAPELGKDGDILLITSTGRLYRRVGGSYPAANQYFMVIQGTKVNDLVVATDTSWSSDKIRRMLNSTRNASLSWTPGATRTISYRSYVSLESLLVNRGTVEFSYRLVKASGVVVSTYTNIGDVNLAIVQLSATDVAAGYDLEITYTGSATVCTALLQAIVI